MNYLFVIGCTIVGFYVPELLLFNRRITKIPIKMNLAMAVAFMFISAYFVF